MQREDFLKRVRDAVQQGAAYRVATEPIPPGTGYVGAGPDLLASLVAEINGVGGTALLVADLEEARRELATILDRQPIRAALTWQHPLLERLGLDVVLRERGIERLAYEHLASRPLPDQRAVVFQAEIGISSVDWAVAETGTLIVRARPGRERMVSLVPPIHVAIVEPGQVVPDLFDVFQALHDDGLEKLPSNLALITGPSKTGDIELQLTTGVHGPGTWIVIVVRSVDKEASLPTRSRPE